MKTYFQLQLRIANRQMIDFGVAPIVGYLLVFTGFIGLSSYLFSKTIYAGYCYSFLAISSIARLSAPSRNDFLKITFPQEKYRKIRLIENGMHCLPFLMFLLYQQAYYLVISLGVISGIMALVNFRLAIGLSMPTPFSRRPFEFPRGFRKTFLAFPLAYFIGVMAIIVGNFNLGVFALLLVSLIGLTYYSKPENEYYVWVFQKTPQRFLWMKVMTSLHYTSILSAPLLLILSVFFQERIIVLGGFLLLSYAYFALIIFAKYANYPRETSLPQAFLIAISLLFPPILLITIPLFYAQSIKQLKQILS